MIGRTVGGQAASRSAVHRLLAACFLVFVVAACAPRDRSVDSLPSASAPPPVSHAPVTFPKDEAPHADLTEWWYYTGHLDAADGRQWGFEFVVFQILRGTFPPFYVSHFAVTDKQLRQFRFDERGSRGVQPQPPEGFALEVGGWRMAGLLGRDRLAANMGEYAIDLELSTDRPPVLHDGGLVTFGPAGDSYYYSRTRMELSGTLVDGGEPVPVRGTAWFDKQWGNFLVLGGGWDWFSIQLDDGTDVMLNLIRDDTGVVQLAYGTYVDPSGAFRHLEGHELTVEPTASWSSPRTGATYPMGWQIALPDPLLRLEVRPVLEDQELDTRRSTGIVYWEGAVDVAGSRDGRPIGGRGYVEMTGYADADRR